MTSRARNEWMRYFETAPKIWMLNEEQSYTTEERSKTWHNFLERSSVEHAPEHLLFAYTPPDLQHLSLKWHEQTVPQR